MDQTKSIELQKKRLESAEERARARASSSLGYPDPPSVLALARSRKKRVWGISSNIPCLQPGMQSLPQILITQSLEPQLLV